MPTRNNDKEKFSRPQKEDEEFEQNIAICCGNEKVQYHYLETKNEYCCYEISMKRMRVIFNKERGEAKAELMIAGYANEFSAVFPSLGCWFQVHEKWGWVNINKPIGTFRVKRGSTRVVQLNADVIEAGTILEGNFEIGSDQQPHFMIIGCGTGISQEIIEVKAHKVKNIVANQIRCDIEIEFVAYEKDCCGC